MRNQDMEDLDALLGDARTARVPSPSDDLMARIAADAEAALVHSAAPASVGWRDWLEALGGWPTMGGLVTAGVAGLWIGAMPTTGVSDVLSGVFGEAVSIELIPSADVFGLEADG